MEHKKWQEQSYEQPLFKDILWSRPEQKSQAGRLLIIGGNAHAITAPSHAFALARQQGIGEVVVALPDSTKKLMGGKLPLELQLVASTPSGSFGKSALPALQSHCAWADATLFAGDIGRNSETAIVLEQLALKMPKPQIYTRDAADYFTPNPSLILARPETLLVLSLAQLQKLARSAKFAAAITFDMQLERLCSALSELTREHKAMLVTQSGKTIISAASGQVIVTKLPAEPTEWRLKTATAAGVWWLQNPDKPLQAIATAITQTKY